MSRRRCTFSREMVARLLVQLGWDDEAAAAIRQAEEYCDELLPEEDPENAAYKRSLRTDDENETTRLLLRHLLSAFSSE